jgi:uncharacterized protein (DUF433 family)
VSTTPTKQYQHLEPRPGSSYRQWFLKGRRIRAAVVWETVHGPDHYTPEDFAEQYRVPIEAVREALDYAEHNMPLIPQERERDAAHLRALGIEWPPRSSDESSEQP